MPNPFHAIILIIPKLPLWQRNYYEHIVRDEDSLVRMRDYIINNPSRWADDEVNDSNERFK